MMNRLIVLAALACAASSAVAQVPCAGLGGQARTNCLNAALRASQQNTQKIEQQNRNLDKAIGAANAINNGAKSVAGGVGAVAGGAVGAAMGGPGGAVVGGVAGQKAGTAAYGATNAIGSSIHKSTNCPGGGNSGVAGTTPQRCR